MRDRRFVAVHRGGPLTKDHHHLLIKWARECSEHVLNLINQNVDKRLIKALNIAKEWENEKTSVGEARKASVGAIAVANETRNPIITAVARSIGHAVATAHMAEYALKAVKISGKSVEQERKWQDKHLSSEISELILTARKKKKLRL